MNSERQELLRLTHQAERVKKSYEPWKAAAVEEQAEELRERLAYFDDLRALITEMSFERVQAGVIWADISRENGDIRSKCSTFASVLYSQGLLTDEQFHIAIEKLNFIPSVTRKARQAAEDEEKALNAAVEDVLNAAAKVSRVNREDVRTEYNKLEGFRSWEKLNAWVKKCVELGYLPKTYVIGVRPGNSIEKAINLFSDKERKAGLNK